MTTTELSNEFSVLLNSFGITPNIVLDEYEKSIFLTEAQEQLIIEAYTGRNSSGTSFEETEEIRSYLHPLVAQAILVDRDKIDRPGVTPYSTIYNKPMGLWFITYESALLEDEKLGCANGTIASVIPITQDELHRTIKNPFRGPDKNRVLRLNGNANALELVSKYNIAEYTILYLEKPSPILLTDLSDKLSIDEEYAAQGPSLPASLHRALLARAVQLAITAKTQLISKN